MFDRFRDQVSPWGAMPEYGDSGDAEWGMFHAWGTWVCALERAGAFYHDPGYRWAAVRMFQAACQSAATCRRASVRLPAARRLRQAGRKAKNRPDDPSSASSALDALALCLADQWRDRRLQPRPPAAASAVSYRREPGNDVGGRQADLGPVATAGRALRDGRTLRPRLPCPRRSTGRHPLLRIRGTCRCCTVWAITTGRPSRPICSCSVRPASPFRTRSPASSTSRACGMRLRLPAKRLPRLTGVPRTTRPQSPPLRQAHLPRGGGRAGGPVRGEPPPQRPQGRIAAG